MISWEDFKRGNKLLLRDAWDWLDGDLWPWLQCLSTIVFLMFILFTSVNVALIAFAIWVAFNLFAMWRTYEVEKRK